MGCYEGARLFGGPISIMPLSSKRRPFPALVALGLLVAAALGPHAHTAIARAPRLEACRTHLAGAGPVMRDAVAASSGERAFCSCHVEEVSARVRARRHGAPSGRVSEAAYEELMGEAFAICLLDPR